MTALAGGGAERVMLTLAGAFADRGLAVDLVLTRAQGAYEDAIPPGIRIIDLKAPRIIVALPRLVRYLRRERPTVMLSALAPTNCLAVWARCLALVDTRLVLSEHSTLSKASAYAVTRRARILPRLMRWSYRWADSVVAVSEGVADDLSVMLGLARSRIVVIHNPVVTWELLSKAKEPLLHPWFLPGAPPVVLGVGRLMAAKDFPTLIRSFARLRRSRYARLMILGEGEHRASLEALVAELGLQQDVVFPGFVANPYQYMANAALFVLSSRWEGLPTVLIEAMACGIPVVATDCPSGPREILEGGKWGKLVPVGAEVDLAEAIEECMINEEPSVRTRAMHFSAERIATHYLNLLVPDKFAS